MKIFLTGGSGFIGQNFCQLVTKKGHYVYAISRKKKRNKNENIKSKSFSKNNSQQFKNTKKDNKVLVDDEVFENIAKIYEKESDPEKIKPFIISAVEQIINDDLKKVLIEILQKT